MQVGNFKSKEPPIVSGVPQGLILGPLLLVIYINDLSYVCPLAKLDLRADDSQLHTASFNLHDIQKCLQDNLNNINWCTFVF